MALESRLHSVRRMQLAARAQRVLLLGTCVVLQTIGLAVLLTDAPATAPAPARAVPSSNFRAEAVAEAFTRAFLSWDPKHPEQRAAALRRFAPSVAARESEAPSELGRGVRSVLWSAVSDDRAVDGGRRITIVAQTSIGFTAVVVDTRTTPSGAVAVAGFPAIVGIPPVAANAPVESGEAVDDAALESTLRRALANFLAGRRGDLAADLLPGASVAVPDAPMRLVGVDEITWRSAGREVSALVRAQARPGGQLRLDYAIGVVRQAGRWFVSWIGTWQANTRRSR